MLGLLAIGVTRRFHMRFDLPFGLVQCVAVGLLAGGLYLFVFLDARANPWVLWQRSWEPNFGGTHHARRLLECAMEDAKGGV